MQCLSLECTCGEPGNHDSITGPAKSKASATYPKALCEAYARLAVEHLKLMGKEEFLRSRMASLQNTIDVAKARIVKRDEPFGPDAHVQDEKKTKAKEARSRSRRRVHYPSLSPPTRREYKAATMHERPKSQARPPLKRRKRNMTPPEVKLKPAKDALNTPEAYWQGGEGKHEALRPSTSKGSGSFSAGIRGRHEGPIQGSLAQGHATVSGAANQGGMGNAGEEAQRCT